MEDEIETALESATGLDWTVSRPSVGEYKAYCSPYVVTVEARHPKKDHTWTFTLEDEGEEIAALGPIQTEKIPPELESFISDEI